MDQLKLIFTIILSIIIAVLNFHANQYLTFSIMLIVVLLLFTFFSKRD